MTRAIQYYSFTYYSQLFLGAWNWSLISLNYADRGKVSVHQLSESAIFVYLLKLLLFGFWKKKVIWKMAVDATKEKSLADYRQKLLEHREVEARLKSMREDLKGLTKQYDK